MTGLFDFDHPRQPEAVPEAVPPSLDLLPGSAACAALDPEDDCLPAESIYYQ